MKGYVATILCTSGPKWVATVIIFGHTHGGNNLFFPFHDNEQLTDEGVLVDGHQRAQHAPLRPISPPNHQKSLVCKTDFIQKQDHRPMPKHHYSRHSQMDVS